MGRVQLNSSWTINLPSDVARQRLDLFFTQHKMRVVQDHAGTAIELKQGSQLITRLIGGWFVNPKTFPKRAEIRLIPTEQGFRVEALIEEALGPGFLDSHLKSRYEDYFQYWMNALRGLLPPIQ
jgi:hypothetical protein